MPESITFFVKSRSLFDRCGRLPGGYATTIDLFENETGGRVVEGRHEQVAFRVSYSWSRDQL